MTKQTRLFEAAAPRKRQAAVIDLALCVCGGAHCGQMVVVLRDNAGGMIATAKPGDPRQFARMVEDFCDEHDLPRMS